MSIFGLATRGDIKSWLEFHRENYERLNNKYWELDRKHRRLLEHLGLEEIETHEIKLRKSSDRASDGRE